MDSGECRASVPSHGRWSKFVLHECYPEANGAGGQIHSSPEVASRREEPPVWKIVVLPKWKFPGVRCRRPCRTILASYGHHPCPSTDLCSNHRLEHVGRMTRLEELRRTSEAVFAVVPGHICRVDGGMENDCKGLSCSGYSPKGDVVRLLRCHAEDKTV